MNGKTFGLLILKILALAVVLMMLNGIGSNFLPDNPDPIAEVADPAATPVPGASFMVLVSGIMLLQTIALAYPIARSKWHGWKLVLGVFVLYYGTVTFTSQLESLVYLGGKMPDGMLRGLFLMGAFAAALFAPIAVLVLGKWKAPATEIDSGSRYQPTSLGEWSWKIALGGLIFLSLYYLFGYFVAWQIPALRDYYGGTDPGSFFAQMRNVAQGTPWMIPFQYVRSLMWVGLAILVIRMMKAAWWEAGLATSILFALPVVYLLLPNDMMPEAVRMGHLIETLPYQFLYGWLAAWLFCRLGAGKRAAE